MSRNHRELRVFALADDLVVDVYRFTQRMPVAERFAMQSQIRRAAVSVTANLVEGCARRSQRDFLRFVDIAVASASETRYLVELAARLGFLGESEAASMVRRYGDVIRILQALMRSIESSTTN